MAILAADMVERVELTDPRKALQDAGALVELVSLKPGEIKTFNHFDPAETEQVDKTVEEVGASDYDALLVPGGVGNPDQLRGDENAVSFVRELYDQGKPMAVICHGPWVLVEAGIARELTLTSWPTLQTDIRNAGGNWVDKEVVVDRGVVTSRKPDDIPAFNKKMLEEFREGSHAEKRQRAGGGRKLSRAALLDLDGTLVDANYQHALAWYRAFRRHKIVVPMWRVHRHIGMGGDQLVRAIAGDDVERRIGDDLRDAAGEEFKKLREECEPLEGARDLIVELERRGSHIVLASSANEDDLDYFLDKLGVRDVVDDWTTADDVEQSKPHPDIVNAALAKAGTRDAVMVGDSRWDIEAARNAGLETVCVITGGWSKQELRDFGAVAVFESLVELRERLDETPLR